jgi:FkbM family methyltransferase
MQNEYYYLGRSMGMARLHGSSSFICVDTRSWESLIYIQGYPVEPRELSIMKRFVGPGDAFLDIGANFGLYSMIASEIVGSKGQIFAFEANPHTYQYLRYSAIANRLIWLPNYRWENLAIADMDGELEFAFNPEHLGGGHIRNASDTAESHTIVKVKSTTIDQFLADNLVVDFVKIDVEGHELLALKGMIETIKRSPSIRILLEYYTYTDEITNYGRDLIDFIRSLGFGLCKVEGNGSLSVVSEEEIPRGNTYLLATRTPELDAVRPPATISIRPKGLHLHSIFESGDHALIGPDGILRYRRDEHQDIVEPALFFGPYIDLQAGSYQLSFRAHGDGKANLSVTENAGHHIIAESVVSNWAAPIKFSLKEPARQFEVVLRRRPELKSLDLSEILIERV